MTTGEVGLALTVAGLVAFLGSVHVGRLGDRFGPRRVLIGLYGLRAAAFVGLTVVHQLELTLVMLSVIALGDQSAGSMYRALASAMVDENARVGLMARMRVVTNIGITLGTVPAGIALASDRSSFAVLLLVNAASYLLAGAAVLTLPRDARQSAPQSRRRFLLPAPATTGLIGISGLMSLWSPILNIGFPLWIVSATHAPRSLIAILYATNTVLAVLVQAPIARLVGSYLRAAQAQRLAGLLLATCCGCLALSSLTGRTASSIALILSVLCLSGGELLSVSASWQISFSLAPADRPVEFFATYGLGAASSRVIGPVLVTSAVLALGPSGWLSLALLFILGGAASPLLADRARTQPLANRPPPPGPPTRSKASAVARRVPDIRVPTGWTPSPRPG